jgi:MATE family multidrug resistance protein
VFAQAWPIILGQALIPLVGVVDVALIGRSGDAGALAGVALGAAVINLVFWTFGFLRMGVTGMTAQAHGAGDGEGVTATLLRALVLGVGVGLLLLLLSPAIVPATLALLSAPPNAAGPAHSFTAARFLGAPAALGFFVINGWLIGLGRTRLALGCQIAMNGINISLDILFVGPCEMGALGVGIGTAIAEWSALAAGILAVRHVLGRGWWHRLFHEHWSTLFSLHGLRPLVAVNIDIMIRTLALLLLFSWFARAGAQLGAVQLAANHILMQLIGVSAYVLDGFAFTAEARVGAAVGAGSRSALLRAIRLTGEFSLLGGLTFCVLFALTGGGLINLVTADPAIRAQAMAMLPYCALIPLLGVPSWLLDGIFIGATRGLILRNAAILATCAYLATDYALRGFGEVGVWSALLASYLYRALSLGVCLPHVLRLVERRAELSPQLRA